MKRYPHFLAMLLVFAMLLIGSGQAWAIGTEADTTISNTASVQYTINGSTSTKNSNQEDFKVDRKIRMVVTSNSDTSVVAGSSDNVLPFTVTNESNTKTGTTDWFQLKITNGTTDDFDMNNVRLYADNNGDGALDAGDTLLFTGLANDAYVSIGNTSGSNSAKYLIIADCPAAGGAPDTATPGITASYNLLATAWAGNNLGAGKLQDDYQGGAGANDPATSEVVYADGPGTSAGDGALDGKNSDEGTYTTLTTINVVKAAVGNGTSGYHIPGDEVTYDIDITNGDTSPATNVIVTDGIPANTTYSAFTTCSGTKEWFNSNTAAWEGSEPGTKSYVTQIRCTIANIAGSGGTSKVTFKVTIN